MSLMGRDGYWAHAAPAPSSTAATRGGKRVTCPLCPRPARRSVLRRSVAARDSHVDGRDLAGAHRVDRLTERRRKCGGVGHRTDAVEALRARDHREIGRGVVDALADPAVLDGAAARLGHALLVHFVVEERAVVAHDRE